LTSIAGFFNYNYDLLGKLASDDMSGIEEWFNKNHESAEIRNPTNLNPEFMPGVKLQEF